MEFHAPKYGLPLNWQKYRQRKMRQKMQRLNMIKNWRQKVTPMDYFEWASVPGMATGFTKT